MRIEFPRTHVYPSGHVHSPGTDQLAHHNVQCQGGFSDEVMLSATFSVIADAVHPDAVALVPLREHHNPLTQLDVAIGPRQIGGSKLSRYGPRLVEIVREQG